MHFRKADESQGATRSGSVPESALAPGHSGALGASERFQELARGLRRTLLGIEKENDFARWNALFDELRTLSSIFPEDAKLQEIWKVVECLE